MSFYEKIERRRFVQRFAAKLVQKILIEFLVLS